MKKDSLSYLLFNLGYTIPLATLITVISITFPYPVLIAPLITLSIIISPSAKTYFCK